MLYRVTDGDVKPSFDMLEALHACAEMEEFVEGIGHDIFSIVSLIHSICRVDSQCYLSYLRSILLFEEVKAEDGSTPAREFLNLLLHSRS